MMRHLPPTAVPLTLTDLKQGVAANSQSIARFQEALRHYIGTDTCLLASSGRTALYLLLKQLATASPTRPEVILPAYTCPALAKVVFDMGLRPLPVDICPHTFAYDLDHLSANLSEQTLALICVHPFGIPQSPREIRPLAHAVGAFIIEDAAQSMGARLDGQSVGVQGNFGLFSLGPGKPLALGGGGVLCTNNEEDGRLLTKAWETLPAVTAVTAAYTGLRLALFNLAFHPVGWWLSTRLGLHRTGSHEASWGYRLSRLSPVQAQIGLTLLPRLDEINQRRRTHAQELQATLQEVDFVRLPQPPATAEAIYLRLPLLVDSPQRREQLYQRLWAAGIGVGRMYEKSLPQLFPQLAHYHCPGGDEIAQNLLTLPTHHYLTPTDISRITQIFSQ